MESTLFFPSSCSNHPSLSRQSETFAHLDSLLPHDLVMWINGCSFFLLAKAALAFLPTAHIVEMTLLFPFRQAHFTQIFLLKPASFCKLFASLGSTNKSAISLLLRLSFYLNLSGRNCLLSPPALSNYNGSPDTRFSRGTTRLMSWPDGERYSRSQQSLAISLLLSILPPFLFFRTGGVLSYLNSSTHRFPRFPPRNLCPSLRSLCLLSSSLQRTQPLVKLLSL